MKYLDDLLRSIDQFFNALIGGNPDCTISAHAGIMAESNKKWQWIADMIDATFAPIEKNHCVESFMIDDDKDMTDNYLRTAIVSVIGCSILYIPIRIMALWH